MKKDDHRYLIEVQFLGFRYSGWQRQPGQRTVEGMLAKTLSFVLPQQRFKLLGASRTDAKVSAMGAVFQLWLEKGPLMDLGDFLNSMNANLPPDIRLLRMEPAPREINLLQDAKEKNYVYLFSFGEKNHPYCAPFMANILGDLDLGAMQRAAALFQGTHYFGNYTAQLQPNAQVIRTVARCELLRNNLLHASFFPEDSYALHVCGKGFMRYQIRMMMGALIALGKGELGADTIVRSLRQGEIVKMATVAPGSGLHLERLDF
ncbi:tRNA pseudouridine synthase A [Maribacter sp. 2307ULW6-5]|uniref:tRNA pseudouridine synthase A n=1 Tax=Maribacter sp. 2307ULW6-5 TaxID=3386275 RepID=UPI0039BD70D2